MPYLYRTGRGKTIWPRIVQARPQLAITYTMAEAGMIRNCASPTRPFRGRALREHEDRFSCPTLFSLLLKPSIIFDHENCPHLFSLAHASTLLHGPGRGVCQYALGAPPCHQGLLRYGLWAGEVSLDQSHVQLYALAPATAARNRIRDGARPLSGTCAASGGGPSSGRESLSRPAFLLRQLGHDGAPLPSLS